jgi:hypothetical protein
MSWLVLGGSLAAVLALAGAARALRLGGGGSGQVDGPGAALAEAEAALPGFVAVAAVVAAGGGAALVTGEGHRVAVVKAHGARLATREVPWSAVQATPAGIVVDTGERRFGRVALPGVDALDIRRLTPAEPG